MAVILSNIVGFVVELYLRLGEFLQLSKGFDCQMSGLNNLALRLLHDLHGLGLGHPPPFFFEA